MRSSRPVHPTMKKALRSHASSRRSSLKQQMLSWVLRNADIRIGWVRMTNLSLSCYIRRTRPMWSGKMTLGPNPRQANSDISEDKPRRDCMRWKRIGGTERQMKCKSMQTQTTPNSSSELWRLSMGPHNLHPPLYYQLMDQHWSRTRKNNGQNILATYWTDLHQSAPLHLTKSLSSPLWISLIIHHQSMKMKSWKPSTRWAPIKHQEKLESQLSCTKLQAKKQSMSSMISSVTSGNKRRCHKISEMPRLWSSTKIKAAKLTTETTGASHSSPSLGRFLPKSSWTGSSLCQKPINQR